MGDFQKTDLAPGFRFNANSSASMRPGASMAQFTATKALPERRDSEWISRAVTSLPEPEDR